MLKLPNNNKGKTVPMHDTITFAHGLASFDVTADPIIASTNTQKKHTLTCGTITLELSRTCSVCNGPMDIHQDHEIYLTHLPLQLRPHILRVKRSRSRCRNCGCTHMQGIPFKDPDHRITKHLRFLIEKRLGEGRTLKSVSREFSIHPSIVKSIDRKRLQRLFENKRPTTYSKYIAIDEFLLHKGHHYATVVIDLESGDILWCEEGKKKEQVYNFIAYMGKDWMNHVKAVCMDMNGQYHSAFNERCPWIAVIFDKFHLIKLYNDRVLTSMRRRKQAELKEKGDDDRYNLYKGSRYIILSDRKTLQMKDSNAHENNKQLSKMTLMGLKWPPGARKMHADHERRLDELLAMNDDLNKAYFLLAQLKYSFEETDPKRLFEGLKIWINMAKESGVVEIISFAKTIKKRIRSFVCNATHQITSGKLEGTNNMIKTVRRNSYGIPDTQYFFWKIMEASRRPYLQYKSHRILH